MHGLDTPELLRIQLELAMTMGSARGLMPFLEDVARVLFRRFALDSVAIYETVAERRFSLLTSSPRTIPQELQLDEEQLGAELSKRRCIRLGSFGVILLDPGERPLPPETSAMLGEVGERLGSHARGCHDHERLVDSLAGLLRRSARTRSKHESQLKLLLGSIEDVVVGWDHARTIVVWNRGAEVLFGLLANQVLGSALTTCLSFADTVSAELASAMERSPARVLEAIGWRADASELKLELLVHRFESEGEVRFLAVVRERSSRRRSEASRETELQVRLGVARAELEAMLERSDPSLLHQITRGVARALDADRVSACASRGGRHVYLSSYDAFTETHLIVDHVPTVRRCTETMLSVPVGRRRDSQGRERAALWVEWNLRRLVSPAERSFLDSVVALWVEHDKRARDSRLLSLQLDTAQFSRAFLTQATDTFDELVGSVLEMLGRALAAQRTYIFDIEGGLASNTFEWCAPGVSPRRDMLQGLAPSDFASVFEPLERDGVLFIDPANGLTRADATRLFPEALGIGRLLAVPLSNAGRLDGFIGVDEPDFDDRDVESFIAPLQIIADLVIAARRRGAQDRALREESGRISSLLASTSAFLYSISLPDLRVDYASESSQTLLGYPAEWCRRPGFWTERLHPDDRSRMADWVTQLMVAGELTREYRLKHQDGTYRWVRDSLRIASEPGRPTLAVGSIFDITERVLDESRLRRLLELQTQVAAVSRHLLGLSEVGPAELQTALAEIQRVLGAESVSFEASPDEGTEPLRLGAPSYVPFPACEDIGWTRRGGGWFERVAEDTRSSLLVHLQGRGGAIYVRRADLDVLAPAEAIPLMEVLADAMSSALARSRQQAALASRCSETERGFIERTSELQASEGRFQTFFHQAPQAMLIVNRHGQIVQSNGRACQMLGYSAIELSQLDVEDLIPVQLRSGHLSHRASFLKDELPMFRKPVPLPCVSRSGEEIKAEIGLVRFESKGAPMVIVGLTDVSERVRALEALEEALREKDTLLFEVHHRVKNNMQSISSLLALQFMGTEDESVRRPLLESMARIRAMALVHETLYGSIRVDHVDLAKYVHDLVATLSTMFDEPAMPVTTACGKVGLGLATSLGLILTELLTNAFKHGRRPLAGAVNGTVRVELVETSGQLTLVVSDGGPGLPEGFDFATDGNLGLKLLRRLTRQVGGSMSYVYDNGARFMLICDATASRRTRRPDSGD